MAQLKDSIVQGSLRVTDTLYSLNINLASATASQAVVLDTNKNLVSKGITDNTTQTAVTTSDTNLITGRTLANAGYVKSSGVTSITITATSPVAIDNSTAITDTGTRTISLADAYGDTKNPFGTKTANYVLAGPSSGNAAAPSFRKLVAVDIPALSTTHIPDISITATTGTLPVERGGTGSTSFAANSIVISGNTTTAALTTRTISNITSNATVTASTDIPTRNTIYYNLATINGADQSHAVSIYGATTSGTSGYILKSEGSGAPTWQEILPVNHGGTGVKTITANSILISGANNTAAITTRTIQNNTTTNATVTANTNIPTMNTLYNALAKINNADQVHAVSIYAATTSGTAGQYLKSTAGTPTWETFSNATVGLGNVSNDSNINSTTGTKGDMIYWSATNTSARLSIGTTSQILKVVDNLPSWQEEYEVKIISLI